MTTGDDSQILKCYSNIMPQDVERFSGLTNIVDKGYAQECFCMKAVGGSVADFGAWEIRESGYPYPVKYKGHL